MMKSWRFHEFGHISNLKMEEVAIPVPAQDEVLIKMQYAGVNPADKFLIMGLYPGASEPPYAVGRDGCGTVVEAGRDSKYKEGDQVITPSAPVGINREGTLAEYLTLPDDQVYMLPHWWTPMEGAAGTKVFLTCWQALSNAANLRAEETVIVSGASGGIGLAGLALAKAMGAKTIALSRGTAKLEKLLQLGADHALDIGDPDLIPKIRALGGADVILDVVGGDFLAKCIEMANPYGRIGVIGALGGIKCEIDPVPIIFKRLQINGMQVSLYEAAESQAAMNALLKVLEPGKVKILIDKVFPFDQVQEAFEHMRGGPMGKVIVGPIGE
ncbi:MAG: zinc-binding alcohol dehydrogenase family protein [Rhodospirillaceae bacterium]|jgi:NADPH:quinone reductase-like Zn-dependent oxidoreductase|nr:zinc-binding alcohol dehydrogenase family protein [Rhodospirillaceae bacterium]MBT4117926.1 zinc-binding alcohol dehydrogenase family protein [Rhodospirillaceae bacterium]MBT4671600.1 zinc-binding alcohol dehydrogenase family protein [Rhodospirillaceae bacterium]MBT4720692.1 zinc-binding alcohol dehydrogenase family protein [Rhodospirillaceae bacterium]MBT4750932.1 zinc-binding alcohol dehydrogenase family protein [Rhodospirillaceae bacterium]